MRDIAAEDATLPAGLIAMNFMHLFAPALQVTDKPGAVVAAALDRPCRSPRRVVIRKTDGGRVAGALAAAACTITAPVCASTTATVCWSR
jgi:hypothetical protein